MQIHSNAINRFSKDEINEFWRVVESINWPDRQDAAVVRSDLMMQMSPRTAETTKRIAVFYILNLVNEFKSWQHGEDIQTAFNLHDLECAASNVIGAGKLNYEEYFKQPNYLVDDVEHVDIANNFLLCMPTEDDYYTNLIG